MALGPCIDQVKHGVGGFGRHEAEHLLEQRMDDGVQAVGGEGLEVVLGLPHLGVAQPGLGAPGQVGDQAGWPLLAGQRGWSPQQYQRFLADTWRRLLLTTQGE